MGIKQKLSVLLSGSTAVGLLGAGAVEESKAESFYGQYNDLYNSDWTRIYTAWKDYPHSALRLRYPTYQILQNAFNSAFNQDYGYLLKDAAPFQTDATILFGLGAVATVAFAYFAYKYRKQAKLDKAQGSKK